MWCLWMCGCRVAVGYVPSLTCMLGPYGDIVNYGPGGAAAGHAKESPLRYRNGVSASILCGSRSEAGLALETTIMATIRLVAPSRISFR